MKKRRFLASLLAVVMLLSVLPAGALAAPTETGTGANPDTNGDLILNKKAILEKDGSYTIQMEAYSTGTSTTITQKKGVPMDVVLVLDQSGSMGLNEVTVNGVTMTRQDLLKKNVAQFIDTVVADGKENKVTHRIGMVGFGSGPLDGNNPWQSTGVFDESGTFVKYQDADATSMIHKPFYGELVQDGEYYVNNGSDYVRLTYDANAQKYTPVPNPDTGRTDLFGVVNGEYGSAEYGDYVVKNEASSPIHGDGNTYFDANGSQLTWIKVTQPETQYVPVQKDELDNSQKYYIQDANGNYQVVEFRHASYDIIGLGSKAWRDANDKKHDPSTEQFYLQQSITTDRWELSVDGKNPLPAGSKVYTHETKKGWHVNGTPVNELYAKDGNGAWVYQKGNEQVILSNEQVYVLKQSANSYSGALVPVTTGENGQGEKRQSLVTATDSIMAQGATRLAFGMNMANKIFQENPLTDADKAAGRQRIVIVFTDGEPGFAYYDNVEADRAVAESYIAKKTYGAKVYTIGLFDGEASSNVKEFLSHLSSDYLDANTEYTKVTNPNKKKQYIVNIDGGYALAEYDKYDRRWEYRRIVQGGELRGIEFNQADAVFYENVSMIPGDRPDPTKNYSAVVTNPESLSGIFQTITQDITSSTTSVDLNDKSVIRDIMPEKEFGLKEMERELTDASTVDVKIVPGTADSQGQITWNEEQAVSVPTLYHKKENPKTGGTTLSQKVTVNGEDMTIKVTTYTINPNTKKDGPHTVDVTGFDYSKQFIAPTHPGAKLVVTIKGLKVLPTASTDKVISTNRPESGLWKQSEGDVHPTAPEAVFNQPSTYFPSKIYVLDYAKPMDIPLKDLKLTAVENLDADGFDPFELNKPTTAIDQKYGKAEVKNGQLTYTPQTMQWDGGDTFYAFGKVDTTDTEVQGATANQFGKAWAKVTVIPANNVYFEDTFTTSESTGTVGIVYDGTWEEVKESVSGDNTGTAEDTANSKDNHGWIPALENEKGDTDGSSHHANAGGNNAATASFTFTGTGVDIYSRTNKTTGTILATLTKDGASAAMTFQIVDTLSASGDYYQIPTLSFHQDGNGDPLPYGTYTVTIRVTKGAEKQGRLDYYLDGIRVYNPAQGNAEVTDKYEPAEKNATFVEVRDVLLDANSFSAENGTSTGAVFIDQMNNPDGNPGQSGSTDQVVGVGSYQDLGPKNEVYLKGGQCISFKVNNTAGNHYYVGLKSPTGATVGVTGSTGGAVTFDVTHTADMYYEIGHTSNGIITITNMSKGDELLSITKLRVTNENAPVNANQLFEPIDLPVLLEETQNFYKAVSEVPVNPDATEPETIEPETQPTEPEVTEPEVTEPTTPDVEITNPEPVEPAKPALPSIAELLEKVFGGFRGWF